MATTQSTNEAIATFVRDTELAHQIVHGGNTSQVQTDGGLVDTYAKTLKDVRDAAAVDVAEVIAGLDVTVNQEADGVLAGAVAARDAAALSETAAEAAAVIAQDEADVATEQANLAQTARASAEQARDAAMSRGIFASTADALSRGVNGLASVVGGSGGANGTFDMTFSGGGGTGAAGRFVVAGGALVSHVITAAGRGYTSAPTVSFAASAGLTGASATAVIANNTDSGEYFSVPSAESAEYLILYLNSAGSAVEQKRYPSAALVGLIDVRTQGLENASTKWELVYGIADASGNYALGVRDTGKVVAPDFASENITSKSLTSDAVVSKNVTVGDVGLEGSGVSATAVWSLADSSGNMAFSVRNDGAAIVPHAVLAQCDVSQGAVVQDYALAIVDENGYASFVVDKDGSVYPKNSQAATTSEWSELAIGSDDSIVHIGDSYTASHYVLKDKAYISQLAALSPYRHQNFGVSGNDALDMQYRIVNRSAFDGITFDGMKARYAFITTLTNDGQFRGVDLTYYAENVRRLIESVRATGTEPVITTEFPATATENALLRRIADEYGCAFIDCTVLDAEIGGLQLGPFHQGHPGTRTGGVFWLPMLDFIDRMPKPDRAIKIFRRRSTFVVSAIADLLYKDRIDRNKRWKEISVAHYLLDDPGKFEELSQLGVWGYNWQGDEYQDIAAGTAVAFSDYALLEVTLPGTAATLEAVELTLTATGTPTVYARNFLDVPASMPGRAQGSTPTDATYLSKWDKPRGAWRSLGVYAAPITITQADLKYSMQGEKLVLMVVGAFSLSGIKVRYKGRESKSDLRTRVKPAVIGANLLTQPLCGTSAQLAAWTQSGTPSLVLPIDASNTPRKPGTNTRVDGVCVISNTNTIGQTVTLPDDGGRVRKYMVTAWARYFPKAFLDPSLYPGLDSAQIVNRITNPNDAPITVDTADLRTLKCEMWTGTTYPTAGGAEFFDFAPLQWRPVAFIFEAVPYRTGTSLSFRLSCPDGEIQVAKVLFNEVI